MYPSFYQFFNTGNQSRLRIAWFEAVIGPLDLKIGKKRDTLFDIQPEKYFSASNHTTSDVCNIWWWGAKVSEPTDKELCKEVSNPGEFSVSIAPSSVFHIRAGLGGHRTVTTP